jgi:hypothetical protein
MQGNIRTEYDDDDDDYLHFVFCQAISARIKY